MYTLGLIRRRQAPGVFQIHILRQSGVVRQQLADRDLLFAVYTELRKIIRYRRVERHFAVFIKLKNSNRRHQHLG